jgi:endonuclease-3
MGLSTMVSDSVGLNVWTKFLSRYPNSDILRREWLRDPKNVLEIIRPLGQHDRRRKIIEAAVKLGAKIPSQVSHLMQHPGIGETIAEKIVGYGFGKPALPLDSHGCKIIARLCKLTAPFSKDEYLRQKLKHIFDPSEWMEVHELLRLHGQSNGSTPETVINLWEQWRALLIQD